MKAKIHLWQITFPLCGVLIFAIGAFTTVYMINGRYLVHLEVNNRGLKITTDVDKREVHLDK